jgi:uncharacterized protein YbjQ (UPF0145 family)
MFHIPYSSLIAHIFQEQEAHMSQFLSTTTNQFEHRRITAYGEILSVEIVIGANIFRDLFASLRDFFGGRSRSYEQVLADAKQQALAELQMKAKHRGADALVGVQFDYFSVGSKNSIMVVCATGTSVRTEEKTK